MQGDASNPVMLRTKDHPEANGRTPLAGERGYTLTFPLESGASLILKVGAETFERFSDMIGRMIIDEEAGTLGGSYLSK